MTPFAVGPLEVRSAALAREVAACDYANRYFDAQASRGRLVETECNGCDGAQGHAIGACVAGTLRVADLGWRRQKYACWGRDAAFGCRPNVLIETINASGTMIVHPVKAHLPRARRLELWAAAVCFDEGLADVVVVGGERLRPAPAERRGWRRGGGLVDRVAALDAGTEVCVFRSSDDWHAYVASRAARPPKGE